MDKPKRNTGNQDATLPPIGDGLKKKSTKGGSPGNDESEGGSRQGNAGLERTSSNTGSRQPKS